MIFETVRLLYEIEIRRAKEMRRKQMAIFHSFSTITDYISQEGEYKRIRH